ncbi:MAG: TraR/DksA C4-type zinc finger protein [Thermoactinomyces sp.]
MNESQLQQLRSQLLKEKEEIKRRLSRTDNYGMEVSMNNSVGELSGYDNHPADLGTEMFERGKDLALNEADERHLQDIEAALRRMETGQYGICKKCGREIPFERLEAVPVTEYCVEHNPQQHSSMRRPVEEKVLNRIQMNNDDSEYNYYDGEDAWQEVEQYGTSNPPDYFATGRNYNELTVDHDEQRGYIDLVEGFSITDLTGNDSGITEITHNQAYEQKDKEESLEERDEDFTG